MCQCALLFFRRKKNNKDAIFGTSTPPPFSPLLAPWHIALWHIVFDRDANSGGIGFRWRKTDRAELRTNHFPGMGSVRASYTGQSASRVGIFYQEKESEPYKPTRPSSVARSMPRSSANQDLSPQVTRLLPCGRKRLGRSANRTQYAPRLRLRKQRLCAF